MLRIIGILLICISVAAFGFLYTLTISFRVKSLSELEEFALYFKSNIRFKSDDIYLVFESFKPKYNAFLKCYSSDFNKSVKESSLSESEKAAATAFLRELGKSDMLGQTAHCEHYSEVFSKLKDDAKGELLEKGKLLKSLSLLASLAVFILLI